MLILVTGISLLLFIRQQRLKSPGFIAIRGEVVELIFTLDKNTEFGEYNFELKNGKNATFPLCFCLTEKNAFPPDCKGDIKYIYNNQPGVMCVPLTIGNGRCGVKIMNSSIYATKFYIPLEYKWTKFYERIVLGIKVPADAPIGSLLSVEVNIIKQNDLSKTQLYRTYQQTIEVLATK